MEDRPGTGRLFRSLHAQGAEDAIVALDPADLVTLRSVSLRGDDPLAAPDPQWDPDFEHLFAPTDSDAEAVISVETPDPAPSITPIEQPVAETPESTELGPEPPPLDVPEVQATPAQAAHTGIPAWAAVLTIFGATVLIGIADVVVTGNLGWLTGIALVVSAGYAAATVRPADGYWVIVSAPLAFLATTVTVGQVTITGGSFFVRQGLLIPFTLGRNAVWIILATAVAAVIVGIRRRRLLARAR